MKHPNSEANLVKRVLSGDRDAFHQLVSEHSLMIRSYLGNQLYRNDEIDDLAQEVFITALNKLDTFQADGNFGSWLRGIARFKLKNHFRAVKRRDKVLDDFHRDVMDIVDPEFEIIAKEKSHDSIEALLRCIEKLPDRMRQVVRAGLDNEKTNTLGREMKISRSAIYNLQYRANKLLRECVEKELTID